MIRPLERDHSCMRHFAYRMDLEGPSAVSDFVSLAQADGFSVASSPLPALVKLVDACGNELLVVVTTEHTVAARGAVHSTDGWVTAPTSAIALAVTALGTVASCWLAPRASGDQSD